MGDITTFILYFFIMGKTYVKLLRYPSSKVIIMGLSGRSNFHRRFGREVDKAEIYLSRSPYSGQKRRSDTLQTRAGKTRVEKILEEA